jgi:hypothetical protein
VAASMGATRTRLAAAPMGVGAPVLRSRPGCSQSVAAFMGFGGCYAREREVSRGREGAGQREREVGTGEEGGIKISLTSGVHV